jgi:hypothetical protein
VWVNNASDWLPGREHCFGGGVLVRSYRRVSGLGFLGKGGGTYSFTAHPAGVFYRRPTRFHIPLKTWLPLHSITIQYWRSSVLLIS